MHVSRVSAAAPGESTVNAPRDRYFESFRRVLEQIDARLEEPLDLDQLSEVAGFSKFHFVRQFSTRFGVGVAAYVQLRRLKRAAYRLAFREQPVLEIAFDAGYEGPEAFARAFKRRLGQSPSDFRKNPDWDAWRARFDELDQHRSVHMNPSFDLTQVKIVRFPETAVAALEHRGDPRRLGDSIRAFIAWRRENRLPPQHSATFNLAYDDPEQTPPEDFRFDLCAATTRPVEPNTYGVVAKTIAAGRCAVLRHVGSDDTLGRTVAALYSEWLPQSGEALRDFPLFFQRVRSFPDVPEHEAVTDVFLPLE